MGRQLVILAGYGDNSSLESTILKFCNKNVREDSIRNTDEGSFQLDAVNDDENRVSTCHLCLDAHVASYFRCELLRSRAFARQVWIHFANQSSSTHLTTIIVQVSLEPSVRYYMDQRFGPQIQLLVNERIELDHIMSCLSTLGGAFSSLGDQLIDCAKAAGKISFQQYKIAEKLCDPVTLMRCQLYLAISFIQCNHFKKARIVITSVYRAIKSRPEGLQEKRVISMCLGIWAKLKYHWHLEKNNIKLKYITETNKCD
ncbi:uncharacterized protein LOC130686818 [Daphnia carinata]|uniref:uncharacterized protein LOC130686818 n=1 Tax=Daphnia carinata TaxID=120202 RepID=UPI00257F74AE|nr:uncharacterized protein LOC130686818 [Daphnia carinata]